MILYPLFDKLIDDTYTLTKASEMYLMEEDDDGYWSTDVSTFEHYEIDPDDPKITTGRPKGKTETNCCACSCSDIFAEYHNENKVKGYTVRASCCDICKNNCLSHCLTCCLKNLPYAAVNRAPRGWQWSIRVQRCRYRIPCRCGHSPSWCAAPPRG